MPIEQLSPELERIVSKDREIQELGTGFGAGWAPAEGPLWWKEGGYLIFSDIANNRIVKWAPGEGTSVYLDPSDYTNGLTRDLQGRLIACEHLPRRVTRRDPDGSITVVANSYRGKQLNAPNDVVVKSDGSIYFTDPYSHFDRAPGQFDLDFSGVYRVSPDLGTISLLVNDFFIPNGLAFSPDERVLYINDSRSGKIRAFDVESNGTLALYTDRVFCDLRGERPGAPDGMKVDVEGNVYCGGSGGIWVMDPKGNHLGTIAHAETFTTNMAWGGDDWKTLFYTTWDKLCSIQLKIAGVPVQPGGA